MKKILWSERIKKAPWFFTIEPYLRPQDKPVSSHPEAREPRIVPLVVLDYGSVRSRLKQMRYEGLKEYFIGTLKEMHISAKSIQNNPYAGKKTMDAETLAELEAYAKSLGVAEIGYTKVNPRYIFRGFRILYENAIVFTIEMDKAKIKGAPNMESFKEVFRTYYQVGLTVNKVAEWMRKRGFNAHAGPAGGGDVNYIPIAIDAGLGVAGKHGLLMTHNHGPRVRLAAVYTDIEDLPFLKKIHMAGSESFVKPAICVWRNARSMRSIRKAKHWPMAARPLSIILCVLIRFLTIMDAHCASNTARSVTEIITN